MKATIGEVEENEGRAVEVEDGDSVRIFGKKESQMDGEVLAKKGDEVVSLGIRDMGVSREYKNGESRFVEVYGEGGQIYVTDTGQKNPVTVHTYRETEELAVGEPSILVQDCRLELGYHTELLIELEQDQRGTEAIRIKADMIVQIVRDKPAGVVKTEAEHLLRMLGDADRPVADLREELEGAVYWLEPGQCDVDKTLPEQDFEDKIHEIEKAAKKIRKEF